MIDTGIRKHDVINLCDKLIEGMTIKTPVGEAKLLNKYSHIAKTDKGCWNWTEIYLAEHGVRCVDREKIIKEIPKVVENGTIKHI